MGWLEPALSLLRKVPGLEVRATQSECCGMAGSFGFKSEFADVSIELGTRLLAEVDTLRSCAGRDAEAQAAVAQDGAGEAARHRVDVLASGTSCRSQIHDLSHQKARHPIELIAERLR